MAKAHHPRRGSLGYRPKKRARRIYPVLKTWPAVDQAKPLDFAGYKVGMTHVLMIDDRKRSKTENKEIFVPVTVLECPPLSVVGVRAYKKTFYGLKAVGEEWIPHDKIDRHFFRRASGKRKGSGIPEEGFDVIRLIVHTRPYEAGIGKKTPEVFEMGIGGSPGEQLEYARSVLGTNIRVSDVFSPGEFVDVIGVTKGKGFSGAVTRWGVKLINHKTDKKRRGPGNLGPWTPKKTSWTIAMPGGLGFHRRTELNKRILKIGDNPEEINVKGGYKNYGLVKSDYVLLKGSVPGPAKRLIRMRKPVRPVQYEYGTPTITYISTESKQGA